MKALDLAGQKFGRLTAISDSGRSSASRRAHMWLCVCDCGRHASVASDRLRSGATKSCGCYQRDRARAAGDRTRTHGMTRTSIYTIWRSMLARCEDPKRKDYPRYGGRGITVCERWQTFENFLADMGERPAELTIDRIDNGGNYEPGNCRWATRSEQERNKG